MILFAVFGAALLAITLVVLIWPILRGRNEAGDIRRARYALHRSILAELEEDLQNGRLSAEDHQIAVSEAEARLVEEVGSADAAQTAARPVLSHRYLIASLVLILPLGAAGLYLVLGNPSAMQPLAPMSAAAGQVGPEQIAAMVARLEAKVAADPSNLEGQLMLARSYRVLQRYSESRLAYEKAWPLVEKSAGELTQYASVLAIENQGLSGAPTRALEQALKLEPANPDALMLAGAAAVQRGDKVSAKKYWNQLLPQLIEGSEDALWLQDQIKALDAPTQNKSNAKP